MFPDHPFKSIPQEILGRLFWPLLALTILLLLAQVLVGPGSGDVIMLQFAGKVETAATLIDCWKKKGLLPAAFAALALDFIFPLVYSTCLAIGCIWVAHRFEGQSQLLEAVGGWLAWGQWVAVLLDYIENAAIVKMLIGPVTAPWPRIAQACAAPKFILIVLAVAYLVRGVVVSVPVSPSTLKK